MGFAIRNAEYVEVIFPASPKQQTFFPDLPNLRQKPVTGIEVYSANDMSKGQSGVSLIPLANLKEAYLVLYFDGGEFIQVPLQSIHRLGIDGSGIAQSFGEIPQLAGQNIVWTKSYVFVADTSNLSGVWASKELVFNVYYNR